jgi:hypothetical protein
MSQIKQEPPMCDFCGQPQLPKNLILFEIDGKWLKACPKCYPVAFSCATCNSNNDCGVQNDTSGTPKVTMETRQQGYMMIQQQVINPILQDKYCSTCRCHTEEGCRRMSEQQDNCPYWQMNEIVLAKI